jgi:tRNA dimethylallyltransferase
MAASRALFLAGPTGVGKSAVGLRLAKTLPGEIVSVDSMQVYRHMDIGTAKPTLSDRASVPHHLIDVVSVRESFDVAQFVQMATAARAAIEARGKVAIFCGGTGLYFRGYLKGLGEAPQPDPHVRAQLQPVPLPELLSELELKDPATFRRIDRANRRRVIRALEVLRLTGRPFSEQQADWDKQGLETSEEYLSSAVSFFALQRSTADLHRRIDERVDGMFAEGLVAETRALLEQGLSENPIALQALGYRQVVSYLRGESSMEDTIQLVKQRTRHYAKRQMTWFRKEQAVQWLSVAQDEGAEGVAQRLVDAYQRTTGN